MADERLLIDFWAVWQHCEAYVHPRRRGSQAVPLSLVCFPQIFAPHTPSAGTLPSSRPTALPSSLFPPPALSSSSRSPVFSLSFLLLPPLSQSSRLLSLPALFPRPRPFLPPSPLLSLSPSCFRLLFMSITLSLLCTEPTVVLLLLKLGRDPLSKGLLLLPTSALSSSTS